jgi:hypothetical protein
MRPEGFPALTTLFSVRCSLRVSCLYSRSCFVYRRFQPAWAVVRTAADKQAMMLVSMLSAQRLYSLASITRGLWEGAAACVEMQTASGYGVYPRHRCASWPQPGRARLVHTWPTA